ncbi:MAG: Hydrolase, TatD family [Candidatus Moranbacteria bacterium GW2011_GWF1_36_4]|nr:MAG: Hydrolase, TatD family [Candidatus Moranbacteria bacterium GW2011_GWF1_36_4]
MIKKSDYSVKFFSSTRQIDKDEWNSILDENFILNSYEYQDAIEQSKINDFRYGYFLIYRENKLIAHVSTGILEFDLDMMAGNFTKRIVNFIRKFIPKFFRIKVIECGHPTALGNTIALSSKEYLPDILLVLNQELVKLAKNEKVVAIGEIGLDYFSHNRKVITGEQKENQKKGFVAQLELAQELDLPVIIHCRSSKENPTDAYDDIYEILFLSNPHLNPLPKGEGDFRMVFHCYGGNLDFTKKLLRHKNIFFSFTPNITYKIKKNIVGTKDDIMESIKIIPLKKIMLETDCPYLAPQEFRGKRSEPMYAKYAAKRIAFIKNINIDKVEKITAENADNFFRF